MPKTAKERSVHLEIQKHRKNPVGVFRTSYYKDGQVLHDNLGSISGLDMQTLKLIQASLQGETVMKSDFHIISGKEYGASYTFLAIAKDIGLDKTIYSRTSEQWVRDALAMIAGRAVYAGSKLSLTRVNAFSTLWEQVGVTDEEIDVNYHCYEAMDKLFARQTAIQKSLANKHLKNGVLILYDMTSTYFEGEYEDSKIVEFGYNRDKKKGKEQITIGLLCGEDGCPVAVRVFRGGEKDADTVNEQIKLIKSEFGLKDVVFVGDRGMITKARLSDMEPGKEHEMLKISALTHARIKKLCEEGEHVQLSMFDETKPVEVILPENPTIRYALSLNPVRAEKETAARRSMVEKAKTELDKIATPKRVTDDGTLGQRVGKIFSKRKVRKFFDIKIKDGKITYTVNEAKIAEEELYDGHYVIFTDVDKEQMDIKEVVDSYRGLANVEQAFENLKSPKLELRPVYHKTDERINCHVFLCMLAYYLVWHMKQRLKPLFDNDREGKKRRYTMEFIIELLKNIQRQLVEFNNVQTYFTSEPTDDQQRIFDLLGFKLS